VDRADFQGPDPSMTLLHTDLPQGTARILPHSQERRRFQRVRVNLLGRYMLSNRQEYPCQVVDMSPGGMALIAPVSAQVGERVIAYIDHLGRLEGVCARLFENGFAMTIAATLRKRRHGRFVPKNPLTMLVLPNGVNVGCRLIDLSLSGAAVATQHRPAIGALVTLGKVQGRVVRHLDDGFAVEFTRLQHPDFLEESVTGG
jgi:hypothetical protein